MNVGRSTAFRASRVSALVAMSLAILGCSGGGGPAQTQAPIRTFGGAVQTLANAAAGTWTGTITLNGVVSYNKEEPGQDDLDPNNTYHETWVTTEATNTNATDTFTISSADDGDLTYGIYAVDLTGTAANSGTTSERYVKLTNKRNSGCTWKQEDGDETTGSWSDSGESDGTLRFSEDGSYSIRIGVDSADHPPVDHHSWLKYSDVSANCEPRVAPFDDHDEGVPVIAWVSSSLEQPTLNEADAFIEGQLNPSNPGSVVDGTMTWQMRSPEGFTMTATWHLVHSTPIVLPHS